MGKNEKTPIVIDGTEYSFEDMTDEQKLLVNHCADLDRKIQSAQFNIQQLQVGKDAFVQMLKTALEKQPAEAKETEQG
jgi:hypothetical protein